MADYVSRTARNIRAGLCTAVLLLSVLAGLAVYLQGYALYSVRSDSMEPVIAKGSALIINTHNTAVQPGDVVSYVSPRNPRLIITHRVMAVYREQGMFIARGDNTPAADDPVPLRNIRGTAALKIPLLGYAVEAVRRPIGLILIVYLPALGIVVAEVRRLQAHYTHGRGTQRRYYLHGY
ncbi:MAG TPA: signal peptidase I [Candidatus Saccharimonadales bacterium]|nr:signal peptidase I [Candidatus Saccharimonadales bacterium]